MSQKQSNTILIYSEKRTPRLIYIFNLILKDILGLSPEFTQDKTAFSESDSSKFSYGTSPLKDEFFVTAADLLFEKGIKEVSISMAIYKDLPCFFSTYHKKSAFLFDLFAASFYLVSRYEEYLPFIKDKYGRFYAKESLAYKKGFLHKPIVNIWAMDLAQKLKEKFAQLIVTLPKYNYQPTIDIDAVYAYKQKGFWRIIGGYLKDIKAGDFRELQIRTKVLRNKMQDPFDSFNYIFDLHKSHNLEPIFFILFAEYGTNDKNIATYNRNFQSLIRRMGDYGTISIHPSFNSNIQKEKLQKEIAQLSKVSYSEITSSRQHFLILQMPETYNNLIDNGITDDYSMGYASVPGFRAGIATPFYFYNLEYEMVTPLKIHPFTYMEGTLKDYMSMNPEAALEEIKQLIDEVKAVGGTFISLWHNESLGGKKRWKGWPEIYEKSLDYGQDKV